MIAASLTACGDKNEDSDTDFSAPDVSDSLDNDTDQTDDVTSKKKDKSEKTTEEPTEAATVHVSPVETISINSATQQTIKQNVGREEGNNTIKFPLSDYIEEGDRVNSFTFVIYGVAASIGEFKGGCGISVNEDCPAATDNGWYQSEDFTAPTEGTYGEITWNVPEDIKDYITPSGEIMFGYWWGDCETIRVQEVICNYDRTRDIPVDGEESFAVGKSVYYSSLENIIRVPTADFLPEGAVPQAVTFKATAYGAKTGLGKYTGAFGYSSSVGDYQSPDYAFFTDSNSIQLEWIVPDEAKFYAEKDGEIMLGYWWSDQPAITLDQITVKYSLGNGDLRPSSPIVKKRERKESDTGFRSANEIVNDIKVGWNLGNTLESYNTGKTGLDTETGWGNVKTSQDLILSVKNAGFNAVRIPITWDEHMTNDFISQDWLNRVKEVVDYAYNNDMYVIINMHHDDYIWFDPNDSEYESDSAKLVKIWQQVSEEFKDYGDRLLFEGMNEPRTVGSAAEWMGGTVDERAVVNRYEQDFVDTVRASGGNNADRTLIITSYAASAEEAAMNDVIVPADSNVIVSLHYYAPWKFSDGQTTTFGDAEKAELDAKFAVMKSKFIDKGVPLIIGEFGCVAKADDDVRAQYYEYYISSAKAHGGIKCFIWDNGVQSGTGAYGILNRTNLIWNSAILKGIMDGAK